MQHSDIQPLAGCSLWKNDPAFHCNSDYSGNPQKLTWVAYAHLPFFTINHLSAYIQGYHRTFFFNQLMSTDS